MDPQPPPPPLLISPMRWIIAICLLTAAMLGLLAYGQYWPKRFQARVPWTNMAGVQRAVGKPLHVTTNTDGSVRWDYARWWSGRARVYFDTNGNYVRTFTDF